MTDIPVAPTAAVIPDASAQPAATPNLATTLTEGVKVAEDVAGDISALKSGQMPGNILQQIQDVEKFGEAVLQIGSILITEFGVHPSGLKGLLPEVLALAKKLS